MRTWQVGWSAGRLRNATRHGVQLFGETADRWGLITTRAGDEMTAAANEQRSERDVPRWLMRVVIVAAIAALAFEQSPVNEALRAGAAFAVLDRTANLLAVAATVALITLAIEGLAGSLIVAGLHLRPRLLSRFQRRVGDDAAEPLPPSTGGLRGLVVDAGIALGVGAGLVVVRRALVDPVRGLRDHLRTCWGASLGVALVSGLIGYLAAGGITHAEAVGLETPAEWLVRYATDWRFWLVLIGSIQLVSWLSRRRRRSRAAGERAAQPV